MAMAVQTQRMGCGEGICHACTVILENPDGRLEEHRTCISGAHFFAGKSVKTIEGRLDDIRACIGCNQACIGHFHAGFPISCIQYPESGRELQYGRLVPARRPRDVLVVGGGIQPVKLIVFQNIRGIGTQNFVRQNSGKNESH